MRCKNRKEKYTILYILIEIETDTTYIYKEVTPLAEKIGLNRATIYRKFEKIGDVWDKNGYKVYKTTNIYIKSRRGK